MERPLISFCLFAYNQEKLVREAVEAAFAQTYSPLEIILSDDGSSDRTFDIMSEMAATYSGPHKIILNRNEPNLGIVPHVNKVLIELASGEIFVLAAGDDVSYPDRAQVVCETLSSDDELMLVGCFMNFIDKDTGEEMPGMSDHFNSLQLNTCVNNLAQLRKNKTYGIAGACLAFRNEVITRFGRLNDTIYGEDYEICMRALLLGKCTIIPDILVKYCAQRPVVKSGDADGNEFVCHNALFEYGMVQASDVNALLTVVKYQWKNGDTSDMVLTRAKYQLLRRLKLRFLHEELSKSFPKISFGLYCRLWKYLPKTAARLTLHKLGLLKLFRKLRPPKLPV